MAPFDWKNRVLRPLLPFLLSAIAVAWFSAVGWGLWWLGSQGVFSVSAEQLKRIEEVPIPDNTVVYDRKGNRIGEFFTHYHVFVPYRDLPPRLVQAILAIEDRHFFQHPGFDVRGMARALWVGIRDGAFSQGASTLTQQIVRHFLLEKDRTLSRKVREVALAYHLEQRLSKERILELYANVMFLGNGAYGVGAAAERYFGRPLNELALPELALVAGLFQSPSAYNPQKYLHRALARQRQVLTAMVEAGYLEPELAEQAALFPLRLKPYRHLDPHPYFVDYVAGEATAALANQTRLEGEGLRIHTTLDPDLQRLAERTIREAPVLWEKAIRESPKTRVYQAFPTERIEAALLAVDPRSGEIRAMVGGRDYERSQFNRAVATARSPGSAFKPVVYSLALKQGFDWNTLLYVAPVTVKDYRPRNLTADYLTETTMLRAFYRSLNTPTVEIVTQLGLGNLLGHARALGVLTPLKPEIGTALGGSEVSPFDLARVYGTFANGGVRVEPVGLSRIEDRSGRLLYHPPDTASRSAHVLSPQVAFLMTEGLRAVLTHGTAHAARHLAHQAVGKTGTSNGAKDNWFCGYTSDLVVIVWVGTDGNEGLPSDAMASTLALPLWEHFLRQAIASRPPSPPERPPGIREVRVHPLYGNRLSRGGMKMFFLSGREPAQEVSPLQVLKEKGSFRRVFE